MPESVQLPTPALVTAVALAEFTIAPATAFAAVLLPVSVRDLTPAPVAVKLLVNTSAPEPEASTPPPPVVPARLITRSVVAPAPV